MIEGGVPLSGTVVPAGNKNAALPVLAASVLTEDEVVVENVPRIRDVDAMLGILDEVGVRVDRSDHGVRLCAADVGTTEIDRELSERIRASFLLAGPLLARRAATSSAAGAWTPTSTPSAPWAPRSTWSATSSSRPGAGCARARCSWTSRR